MFMAIELIVSKISRGQSSEGSGHNETHYNSLKCNSGLLLNLNIYQMDCLGRGLNSPSDSSPANPDNGRGNATRFPISQNDDCSVQDTMIHAV